MNESDCFQTSSNTQLYERKYFQTFVLWNVACIRDRAPTSGSVIFSPLFKCSDASWRCRLYPYGEIKGSEASCCADFNLMNVNPKSENSERIFTTFYKINASDMHKRSFCKYVSEKCIFRAGDTSRKTSFRTSDFTRSGIADYLAITVEICVEENVIPASPLGEPTKACTDEKEELPRSGSFLTALSSDFEKLYDHPQLSDVILKLGDEEFQAHKSVLSARSKVFAAMFEYDTMEKQMNTVHLVEMEKETVLDMLRYIYCGNVRELSHEQALNLYVVADRYDLKELRNFCREIISHDLSVSSFCDIAIVADLHNDAEFTSELKSFLTKHGKEIIKTEKWKSIFTNQPILCAKMLEWIFSD